MPEGPEVRRSADFLNARLKERRVASVEIRGGRFVDTPPVGFKEFVSASRGGLLIHGVDCKGKFMWWSFDQGWKMWCTYGMSGQWNTESSKHTALAIFHRTTRVGVLEDCTPGLYFNDPRHFGTIKFVNDEKEHERKLASLGPDMLSDPPSPLDFCGQLAKRKNKTIAEALMDQSVVSGVGNYVKAEALYLAELSPHRPVSSLSAQEAGRLRQQIINVVKASYATGGATFSTYKNPDGSRGEAQRRFMVYGNKTDPMGNPVVKEETKDGRTTHWVPTVQR